MSEINTTYGFKIGITPWMDTDKFRIVNLYLSESFGTLAGGNMTIWNDGSDEALKMITEENYGTIRITNTQDIGSHYSIPFTITTRTHERNVDTFEFVCCTEKKFFTDTINASYTDIPEAINGLYHGNLDICDPDSSILGVPVYQTTETSYDFLEPLLYSYKSNSVWSLGWEGLMIKEIPKTDIEPEITVASPDRFVCVAPISYQNNKKSEYIPEDPWTKKELECPFKNASIVVAHTEYNIIGKKYEALVENKIQNQQLLETGLYGSVVLSGQYLPDFKLGDYVKYIDPLSGVNPYNKYIVAKNEMHICLEGSDYVSPSGSGFEFITTLLGLDKGTWSENTENNN